MKQTLRILSSIPETAKSTLFIGTIKECYDNVDNIFKNIDEYISLKKYCIDNNHKINFAIIPDENLGLDVNTIQTMMKTFVKFFCRTANGEIDRYMVRKLDKNVTIKTYTKDYDADKIFSAIKNSFDGKFDYIIQNPPRFDNKLYDNFIQNGKALLKDNSKMMIVTPETMSYKMYFN